MPRDVRQTNPQTLWDKFKDDIRKEARLAAKSQMARIAWKITNLKKDLASTLRSVTLDTEEDTRWNAIALEREIDHLEKKRYKSAHLRAQANWQLKGESINRYWTRVNNPRTPRDLLHRLRDPTTNRIETRSDKMANITAHYHKCLQEEGLLPETNDLRRAAIAQALDAIPVPQRLTDPDNSPLNSTLPRDKIGQALRNVKLGTAAGPDGIPYELWKHLDDIHKVARENGQPYFDVIGCMSRVIQDIQTHGVDPTTNFTLGYLCPIHKKKERDDIKNYRPITLLNTDYKLMTKSLALQLATHVHQLVHPDQTGFIPNRTIFDPIRLTQTICAYADFMEEDGAIVALDQEKAYDKIDHGYLAHVLCRFNLPEPFIKTIQSLYENAHTAVMVNGELSPTFRVTRGVRQGDPLSCLLFDLAIEPLACMLRSSPNLKGFSIPGIMQKVIVTLYADDTTVFLSSADSYTELERILSQWCLASGAKFNLEKTEVVPVGSPEHRAKVASTRCIHNSDPPLHPKIRIAEDGHAVRCLGAWIGNGLSESTPWNPVLDKVKNTLSKWNKGSPSLDARGYIVQMFAGGMTQFLTKAQGMPKDIESALVKIIREFVWGSTTPPPISLQRLYAPKNEGGLALLDIPSRNKAISLTWLKAYLDLSPSWPTWAFVTDAIINHIRPDHDFTQEKLIFCLTSWRPPTWGRTARTLPHCVLDLLKTARTAGLSFAPLKLAKPVKLELPAWYHLGAPPRAYNKLKDDCLQRIHRAHKVKNLLRMSKRLRHTETQHQPRRNCACRPCHLDREEGCTNPHKCATTAKNLLERLAPLYGPSSNPINDNLSLTHRRLEKNQRAIIHRGDEFIFNPSVTSHSLSDCFRVFVPPRPENPAPLHRPLLIAPPPTQLTAYTDGSCL